MIRGPGEEGRTGLMDTTRQGSLTLLTRRKTSLLILNYWSKCERYLLRAWVTGTSVKYKTFVPASTHT